MIFRSFFSWFFVIFSWFFRNFLRKSRHFLPFFVKLCVRKFPFKKRIFSPKNPRKIPKFPDKFFSKKMKNFKSQKTQVTQRKVRFSKRKISKKRPKNTPFFPKFPPKISPGELGGSRSNFEDFPPKNTPGAPARIGKKYFFSRKNHDFFKFLKIRGSGETVLFCVRSSLKIFKNSVFFENFDENLMKNLRKMGENLRAGKHRGSPENLRSNFAFLPPEKPPEFSESVNREISSFFLIFSKNHKKNIFFEKSEKRMFCAETSMKNLWFLSFFRRKFSKI